MDGYHAERVIEALKRLAILRQADVGAGTYAAYVQTLAQDGLEPGIVVDVCERLAKRPRGEGETAFPDYGTLAGECRATAKRRALESARAQAPKALPEPVRADLTRDEAKRFVDRLKAAVERRRSHVSD